MKVSSQKIFINYSIDDNESIGNKPGWVESFSYVLKMITSQILKITLDVTLREDLKGDQINSEALHDFKAVINIYSPAFLNDPYANSVKESLTKNTTDSPVQFSVIKNPVVSNGISSYHYEFYSIENSAEGESWDSELENDHSKDYWLKVVDLSYDLAKVLKKEEIKYLKTVYLAECNPEKKLVRDAIKRDLNRHGYKVLPEKALPTNKEDIKTEVFKDLKEASLSIHVLSDKYGDKTILKNMSLVDYQNKLAAEYCRSNKTGLKRIIWLPPDHKYTDLEQNEYLEQLRKNKEELEAAELIQTPVELLKSLILSTLDSKSNNVKKGSKQSGKTPDPVEDGGVYIVHDANDKDSVTDLINWFKKKEIKIHLPDFELENYKMMLDHKEKLVKADSVIIFCKNGNLQWSKTKIKDTIKAPGFGRVKPFEFKCLYIASKHNMILESQVEDSDFLILKNVNDFSDSIMTALLSNVK